MYALTWSSAVTAQVSHVFLGFEFGCNVPIIVSPYFLTLFGISDYQHSRMSISTYAVKSSAGYTPLWKLCIVSYEYSTKSNALTGWC